MHTDSFWFIKGYIFGERPGNSRLICKIVFEYHQMKRINIFRLFEVN